MVMKMYIENLKSFREDFFRENRDLFRKLEEGQSPDTMMITCSDSRIVPHMKTGSYPGEMFLFRNMGNFVSPYQEGKDDTTGVAAFLEYGTQMLGAKHIIVMGHTNCGAIKGIFKKTEKLEKSSFIKSWLRNGESVRRIVMENYGEDDGDRAVELGFRENVKLQMANIRSFPFIRDGIQKKQITIHGWLYEVKSGSVYFLDDKDEEFQPLE